ncbi:FUSC family protein [Streptomyces sp. NPDC090022]|uniref:FUSC family protein n=1 Tax=Streptomyces sp. NPDC090022 TaxID=3365920 RepID=UPI00381B0DD6
MTYRGKPVRPAAAEGPAHPAAAARRRFGAVVGPAARLVVCAAVSWGLCVRLGTSTAPVPAALPAVLILRGDLFAAPRLALERLAGVVVGVLVGVAVLHWFPVSTTSFLLMLVCGCAGMYLLGGASSPNQQVLISALLIYATPVPGYPLARLAESTVGIAVVALLGPLLWPPDPCRAAREGLDAYRTDLSALLDGIAARAALGQPAPAGPGAAGLWQRPRELAAQADGTTARLRLLPWRSADRTRLADLRPRLRLAARTALTLQFFTDELADRARDRATVPDEAVRDLAPLLRATARALDEALRGADCTAALRRARALDAAHRTAHPTRHDAVLRTGLHLTHEALTAHLARPAPQDDGTS